MIKILTSCAELREYRKEVSGEGYNVGFVPTMGALHEGHLALVKKSIEENRYTIVSIFVNPIQFNNAKDLEHYPRNQERDIELLRGVGCQAVFIPTVNEIYPHGEQILSMSFGRLDTILEGAHRPGHFSGVGLIVAKLFNLVQPDVAYFGEKDWQQVLVVKKLTADLSFPVKIKTYPTVRESSGLAMSSRNERLTKEGRVKASMIYRALSSAGELMRQSYGPEDAKLEVIRFLGQVEGIDVEYVEVLDANSLSPIPSRHIFTAENRGIICIACYVDGVRLIDNILI